MIELTDYPNTGHVRVYDIEAISLPIVYNKFGDHDPNGLMYVLKKDSERIQRKARELFSLPVPQPYKEVQPLVIRANVGDTVRINFENKLNRRASIHVQGICYDVFTSDGANVGFNPDTTTDGAIRYIWHADKEGVYLFSDMADPRSNEQGSNVRGLFGAIVVEAAGSYWLDPITGEPIDSPAHSQSVRWRSFQNTFNSRRSKGNARFPPPQSSVEIRTQRPQVHYYRLYFDKSARMLHA